MLKACHLIEPEDLTTAEMDEIFNLTDEIIQNPLDFIDKCRGKILATLFYEPSTRTRLSFESAMIRLGGEIIGFSELGSSSVSKGESLPDTIKTVGAYSDIIAMRHPKEGAAKYASMYSNKPIVNAGDGGHQHPTQTLTDVYTIRQYKQDLDNMTIGLCGDLKFGRTVHSLIKAMSRYNNIEFIFISPDELTIPKYIREEILDKRNIKYREVRDLEEVMEDLDVLYMTRVQKERFFNEEEYIRLRDSYILDEDKLLEAKEDLIIMHPLPRVNEIDIEVDKDERAVYFQQVENGMYVRMALILKLLGVN